MSKKFLSNELYSIFIAIFGWNMPAVNCFESIGNGIVFAHWPIMWIVLNALFIYNVTLECGFFEYFRRWMLTYTPPDKRIILLIVAFSFGALLEGKNIYTKFFFYKKNTKFFNT